MNKRWFVFSVWTSMLVHLGECNLMFWERRSCPLLLPGLRFYLQPSSHRPDYNHQKPTEALRDEMSAHTLVFTLMMILSGGKQLITETHVTHLWLNWAAAASNMIIHVWIITTLMCDTQRFSTAAAVSQVKSHSVLFPSGGIVKLPIMQN